MTVQFGCPCGRSFTVADERKGTEKKCPDCGRLLMVPRDSGGIAQEAGAPATVVPEADSGPALPTKGCPQCGARIAVSALACRHCGAFLDAFSDSVTEKLKDAHGSEGLPCERPDVPFWTGMLQTLRMVWLEPRKSFTSLSPEPALGRAATFAALFGGMGLAIYFVWQYLLEGFLTKVLPPQIAANQASATLGMTVLSAGASPVAIVLCGMVGGCFHHLGLVVTGATRRDLSTTLAVTLYVMGAGYAALAIPLCGALLGLWILVLAPMALIHAHGCETWKGVAAVYWPLVLCCVPLGIVFLVFMARSHVGV